MLQVAYYCACKMSTNTWSKRCQYHVHLAVFLDFNDYSS
uniref:Uncharacterized protein n=1 Tax=Vitis vinifera TaxID=29760 RepID=F6H4W0_VITVI